MGVSPLTYFQEPDEWLRGQLRTGSPRNWYGISDPKLDPKLDEQLTIMEEQERIEKVYEIQRYVLDEGVNPIPLVTRNIYFPRHSYFKNLDHTHPMVIFI